MSEYNIVLLSENYRGNIKEEIKNINLSSMNATRKE